MLEDFRQILNSEHNRVGADYYVASLRKWGPLPDGAVAFRTESFLKSKPTDEIIRGHTNQIQDLVEAIIYGRAPKAGFEPARDRIRVVYAAYLSAEQGKRLELKCRDTNACWSVFTFPTVTGPMHKALVLATASKALVQAWQVI